MITKLSDGICLWNICVLKEKKISYEQVTPTITIIMRVCRACLATLNEQTDAVNLFDDLYKNRNLSILLLEVFNFKVNFGFV